MAAAADPVGNGLLLFDEDRIEVGGVEDQHVEPVEARWG
jgi:hypothetical protein